MRTHVLIGALAAFLMVSCEGKSGTEQQSLEVSPETMTFGAESGTQRATVTAQGVEWTHEVAAEAAEWLSAERSDDKTLTVTVAENAAPEQRSGRITVSAEGSGTAPCVITVTQQAAEITYGLTVEPASLDFVGTDAPSQQVTVTTEGEGLTWTAEPEEAIAEWVTLAVEGDKITVSVADNPLTTPRAGLITVTPSVESAGAKAIRVTQAGCDPEFSATPLELTFPSGDVSSEFSEPQSVEVVALGVEFHVMYSFGNGDERWAEATINVKDGRGTVEVKVKRNTAPEARTASVYLVPNDEELGFGQIEIKVTQEAAPEYRSNLTENVVMDIPQLYCYVKVGNPSQTGGTYWEVQAYGADVLNDYGIVSGTGDRLYLPLVSTLIERNDDNEYDLPEGTYTIATAEEPEVEPWWIVYPYRLNDSARYPSGATFTRIENDVWTVKAPLVEGTMEVSRSGDIYTLQFDFKDDQGYSVTGTYEGPLDDNMVVS